MIIAQATEGGGFICEYDKGSTSALDLEVSHSSILRSMLSDGDLVSVQDKAIVEPVFGRDEVKGGKYKEENKLKMTRKRLLCLKAVVWPSSQETSTLFLSLGTLHTTHSNTVNKHVMRVLMPMLLLFLIIYLEMVLIEST